MAIAENRDLREVLIFRVEQKRGGSMRISLPQLAAIGIAVGFSAVGMSTGLTAQTPVVVGQAAADVNNPVADPRAVVTVGNARFTVLTPELIRMEWAADGKFEDHASFVFLNRRLPVPKFEHQYEEMGASQLLTIKTSALQLTYSPVSTPGTDNRFTAQNLKIELKVNGKPVTWHPGLADPENLQGTTRTLDGALGSKTQEPIEPGLVSRSGWALVDDSKRPLFDSADFRFLQGEKSPWPWVMERPAGSASGLVLLRLWPRLPQSARRLCARGGPDSAAAALRLRRVVVALLGLHRPGTRRAGQEIPRERHAAGRSGDRHGLAHQQRAAPGRGRGGPVGT